MKDERPPITGDINSLAEPYLQRKKRFSELNLREPQDQSIAKYCLAKRPGFISELDANNPLHIDLLRSWIIEDYSNYITIVRNGLDHADLRAAYLYLKFKATVDETDYTLLRSYDKFTLLCYRYETRKGDTISYFDKALGVPSILKVTADVKVKIVDSLRLLKCVDVDLSVVDLEIVMAYIDRLFNNALRDSVLDYIVKNDLSYYMLPQHYTQLSKLTQEKLEPAFYEAGLKMSQLDILDIAIPNNTNEMFERQFFALAEAGRVKDFENKQEQISLMMYEKKAAIHSKYPDFPVALTESEKDFALNRYLKRVGMDKKLSANITKDELDDQAEQATGTVTQGKMIRPKAPVAPQTSTRFRTAYIILLILFLVGSSLCFIESIGAALIAYGITVFIFGILAAAKKNALKKGGVDAQAYAEYKKQYEEYKREYANYAALKNENSIMK